MSDIRIETGNEVLEIVLVQSGDAPLSVRRWGPRGAAPDLPAGQSAVEILTVDAGRAPSTPRGTGGVVSQNLRYVSHTTGTVAGWVVLEVLLREEDGGLEAVLTIQTPPAVRAARATVTITNRSADRVRVVQAVSSVALQVALGAAGTTSPDDLDVASANCDWIGESRWSSRLLRGDLVDLALGAHGDASARGCLSYAGTGSWSTGRALPVGALIETRTDAGTTPAAYAWQIESNGGWRWEVGENTNGSYLALGGPTDADSQWLARLAPGDSFSTVPATLGTGAGIEGAFAALTDFRRAARRDHPDNQRLSVVFNDYMNTLMGDPTTEKLLPLIDAAAEAGAEYFCVDAGWYDDSGDWWDSVGDWEPSTVRFPNGLGEVIDRIRSRDMQPGLWLEPEVVGVASPAAERLPAEAFFSRHGERVVEHGRYHLDLRHPAAIAHLDAVVDRLVNDFGVRYFKLDYNINPGPGTDRGAASPGDGLLQHNRAHLAWLESVLDRHPDLVLENCASGAMRMDFAMLSRLQLQSTSDQQDPQTYAPIAAAAPLMMLPEQAANWAYPQPGMTDEEIAFALCTGILGRFYLSGYLNSMTMPQQVLVAEAVAAHKRMRHELAVGHASWPLGIDQWTAPWVALAIGTPDTRHLTLWKRDGADPSVQVPLPDLAGLDLVIDTVFPRRLEPWQYRWDKATAVLTITAGPDVAARTLRIATRPMVEQVTVDAGVNTGAVHGGATGMLYGLADEGVPSAALIAGVRPRTMAQKAPHGKQHPNGDALSQADGYFAAGGSEMVVYMQDVLAEWPYEEIGIDRFCELAQAMVTEVAARPDAHKFVWVPFNEGDWIWYADWSAAGRARFLADWATMYRAIRAVDPAARIVGPNESHYYPDRVRDFFVYCVANDVVPQIMSWHELQPSSLEVYPAHYRHYRELEAELGFGPLPINIDEYGNRRDMSNPAQLVQWIDLFETSKVDADLAYWTLAGNLDDHAVNSGQANGGWWLLHWYAGLTGHTVPVTVPHPDVRDSLRALAAWDATASSLTVLLGGTVADIVLDFTGLNLIGPVRVRVSSVTWSGYEGDVSTPTLLCDDAATVQDGTLAVRIPNRDPHAGFLVVVTPDGGGTAASAAPWSVTVDTDAARTEGGTLVRHGDDPQHYTGSGRHAVTLAATADAASRVTFPVTVPADGDYLLGITYGTDATPVTLGLTIDGAAAVALPAPATLYTTYTGRLDTLVTLTAGAHEVTVAGKVGEVVAIDRVSLTRVDPVPRRFDAIFAWRTGGTVDHTAAVHGPGSVTVTGADELTFYVAVPRTGRYTLSVSADTGDPGTAAPARLAVDGVDVGTGQAAVYLAVGVSVVTVRSTGAPVRVHSLSLAEVPEPAAERLTADRFTLAGSVRLVQDAGVAYLDGFGGADESGDEAAAAGPAGSAVIDLPDLAPGAYLLTLEYSNADRATGHMYNADVINRRLAIQRGDDAPTVVVVRHNYSWTNYQPLTVRFDVVSGTGPLRLAAVDGPGPRVVAVRLNPLVAPGGAR
ncbi:alpha-galactosidase [Cryobacterium sp.]|uniref:alpha-galactosidase n=1 Tax=Cryobacterium sp. TaxID=1926290 RepID=UPI0026336F91|nr:alpha-galactosidase [Cryobacterium sp.]MCU1444442.1 alpha-galactosidase [Cryobacterium sp.]